MSTTTFKDDIERKLDIIWRFIVWVIAFLISLALCLPGIFISLQYSQDDCVKGSGDINIALDWWLFIACSFVLLYMIVLVVFICSNAKTHTFKFFWIIVHIVQLIWYSIGIYLIVNSTLKCQHNSLWQMSLAYCCIMGVAWVAETFWIVLKWCGCEFKCCKCTQCLDAHDDTYYFPNGYSINTQSSPSPASPASQTSTFPSLYNTNDQSIASASVNYYDDFNT
jgi:hypothetical protein